MFLRTIVFYGLTWFFLMLLGGIQQASGLLPPEIGLAQWGPGIAALLMLVIFRKDGHKILFFSKDTPVIRYVYAALMPVAVGLVVLMISLWVPIAKSKPQAIYDSLWLILLWLPLGALGEEIGWRGYLNKMLDRRLRGLISALLVGVLWTPIHFSFFAEGPVYIFFLTLSIISYSVVIYALVQDTGFSVILASIFHLSINLTNLLFLDVIYETTFMMINGIAWAVVAAIVVLARRNVFIAPKSVETSTGTTYHEYRLDH
jgi:membrane protease YdiL (CAAX protease family)